MGNSVLRDVFTGAALLVGALIAAILMIPVLVILSVFLHVINWLFTAIFSLLLLLFVLWGIGFLYRKAKQANKNNGQDAAR
jgi:ABC-type bacteriocin/lantibiotic exporter with double-glycine peptidase domain